jgi:hypothetical protein
MSTDAAPNDAAPNLDGLYLVAGLVAGAQRAALEAAVRARKKGNKGKKKPKQRRFRAAMARLAAQHAGHALGLLGNMGLHRPFTYAPAPIPEHLLDTPDTRELLGLLERARVVAERIDAARGFSMEAELKLPAHQSHGNDLAESISEIALRVRTEVHGPVGRE